LCTLFALTVLPIRLSLFAIRNRRMISAFFISSYIRYVRQKKRMILPPGCTLGTAEESGPKRAEGTAASHFLHRNSQYKAGSTVYSTIGKLMKKSICRVKCFVFTFNSFGSRELPFKNLGPCLFW